MSDSVRVSRVELRRSSVRERLGSDDIARGCPLVKALKDEEADQLFGGSLVKRFADQAAVFTQGDSGDAVFLVFKGEVRLMAGQAEFAVARKGDLFGEAELVTSRSVRSISALARGEVDVIELPTQLLKQVGRINRAVVDLIRGVYDQRSSAQKETSEFLNRW